MYEKNFFGEDGLEYQEGRKREKYSPFAGKVVTFPISAKNCRVFLLRSMN